EFFVKVGISEESEKKREQKAKFLTEIICMLSVKLCVLSLSNPESYMTNSVVETRLLNVADSFQRQYTVLFPDRKPLLLCPLNECGVKKFVSTTLQPSASSHCELQTWQGCAYFVANFLSLELLEPPPKHLFSPTSVLRTRRATCFEFATLLCSLLLGINYDAYCVSGYAAKEMCLLDQSQFPCPLLDSDVKVGFLLQLYRNIFCQEEDSQQQPEDLLRGLRVHCWVLVLAGSGSIRENFFIDPLTGSSYPTDSSSFLGIESVWNDLNYHVNMQDCRNGCVRLKFDLDNTNLWEPVLHGATSRKQLILDVLNKKENRMISTEKEVPCLFTFERVFEMPRSWVTFISIHEKDLETLWPDGKKVTFYKKAKLEKFAPYLNPDGVITRLTTYKHQDCECAEVAMVKEWYKHRNDSLEEREVNKLKDSTSERFKYGRRFQLLCKSQQMEFSSYARPDYLARRVWSTNEMEEFYEGRRDFLWYRQNETSLKLLKLKNKSLEANSNEKTVVERFHRNAAKPANEDVAERVFLVSEEQFELTYHLMDHRFIPSRRILTKPLFRKFSNDCVSTFQVSINVGDTRELHAKQNQYRRNHLTMTEKQLEEYQCFCSEKTTQIKATQIRLNRYTPTHTHTRTHTHTQWTD
uniref:Dynein regulatory complex subunit 7 n=1 Tax=Oryzias latipes TaxID=8090 RepID=A0A3P9JPI0_ORYLA